MTTDNWPVDFRYISTRLVKEIVQQHEAARSHWRFRLGLQAQALAIGLVHLDPDYANKLDLCRRATEAVSDYTGTLAQPGEYVREELDIVTGFLTVLMGWEKSTHVEIAAMQAVVDVPEVGTTLVALFGSASNYSGRRPRPSEPGEIPSDVDGLYGLLEATREARDPVIQKDRLWDDARHSPESRADLVVRLAETRFRGFASRRLDILMRVFTSVDAYQWGSTCYDRVLIGAPVWAATPAPRPLSR